MSKVSSMTGYGEGRAEDERVRVSVSIRSVNHRFLDLSLRLPEAYRALELDLSARIKEHFSRGRIEARYRIDRLDEPRLAVKVRRGVAAGYLAAAAELDLPDDAGARRLSAADLLRLPEVVGIEAPDDGPTASERELLLRATEQAIAGVEATRRQEGAHLDAVLRQRLDRLEALRAELAAAVPELRKELMEALEERLQELLADRGIDSSRLAQEAAVLAERSDVSEELDRLAAHFVAFGELLDGEGGRGKRLDFLSQEILRELNTVGAKCRHSAQLERVVEAKVVCEQLREQVQNIE